ncbi:MAG: hypothetical protein JG775_1090, partial [Defluviitaleaceae bacterium]|nr:hypothetical protein [Defluviitaleaceae bacterium]
LNSIRKSKEMRNVLDTIQILGEHKAL